VTAKAFHDITGTWKTDPRWRGIERPYTPQDVDRLRGTVRIDYTLASQGAERLWDAMGNKEHVAALGAMSGNQAIQMVQAGLRAIYVSGWQVAGDANTAGQMYPDQSLYPCDSVPNLVRRINNSLLRADQICHSEGHDKTDWVVPLVADAEAGFGGPLNAFEIMKAMIEAGAAGVHFEDQLSSAKKCGHMGGKVLVSTCVAVQKLIAARFAADVMNVPTVLIARTDANGARLITNIDDERDREFIENKPPTVEGFHHIRGGIDAAVARGLSYAPYCDVIWCETSEPSVEEARRFAEGIHKKYPEKRLAYNCSPSFNWKKKLDDVTIARFQRELNAMGYKFQFITLAGFHTLNHTMFELAREYKDHGMAAYSKLQEAEFRSEAEHGYSAVRHQRFVGTGYFDEVMQVIANHASNITALGGSTEEEQFEKAS
jgi:isocitrate lyase